MKRRHALMVYALEAAPRPGDRESRVRGAPDGVMIRSERGTGDGKKP